MTFELSDSLRNDIIFAMENQSAPSVLDAATARVQSGARQADEENVYSLPAWTSDDGYALMESFAENCHSPLARVALKDCLKSRRGVFKSFKNVLREYPLVEKRWHYYKTRVMGGIVNEWYNALCEVWGLERHEQDTDESETDDILQEDFSFRAYEAERDAPMVRQEEKTVLAEAEDGADEGLSEVLREIRRLRAASFSALPKSGFVCYESGAEGAGGAGGADAKTLLGCALVAQGLAGGAVPDGAARQPGVAGRADGARDGPPRTAGDSAVCVTDFFVAKPYRGLGIAKKLLSLTLEEQERRGARWVVFSPAFISDATESLLEKFLFKKTGGFYVLDLREGSL